MSLPDRNILVVFPGVRGNEEEFHPMVKLDEMGRSELSESAYTVIDPLKANLLSSGSKVQGILT
jgi:hypothetical protein